jgi:hypothetical protein
MAEMQEPGTNLTNKCNDTTDANILSTSQETPKPNNRQGQQIRSRRHVSGTNVSSAKPDPLPKYLVTDLHRLTFKVGEKTYQADDTEHTFAWTRFISDHANIKGSVDWDDLEERAHFLNMLYAHHEALGKPFPLDEIPEETATETFNAR